MQKKTILLVLLLFCGNSIFAQETQEQPLTITATYYADRFVGRRTSSGELFSQKKYTAAHKTLKLGSFVKITNPINQKFVIVKINDRCPRRGILDLSKISAERLNIIARGYTKVILEKLPEEDSVLWKAQEEIFEYFDKLNFSENERKKHIDSSYFLETPAGFDKFIWLRIATAENLSHAQIIIANIPEKYQLSSRAIPIGNESPQKYKILLGPYINADEAEIIKNNIKNIFPQTIVEKK